MPFLAAQGHSAGASLLEGDKKAARGYLATAAASGVGLVLPADVTVAAERSGDAPCTVVSEAGIQPGQMVPDIGPQTAGLFAGKLARAGTIFWNGPMGVAEIPSFAAGTRAVAAATQRSRSVGSASPTTSSVTSPTAAESAWSTSRARPPRPTGLGRCTPTDAGRQREGRRGLAAESRITTTGQVA